MSKEKSIEKEFQEVKDLMNVKKNGYNMPFVFRQLHENQNLRRTYLSVIKTMPSRISEVMEEALITKPTCYAQLYKLLELGLVRRVYVADITENSQEDKEIKEKFSGWTKTMSDKLKRYYFAKTSFWVITDFGKCFAMKAWNFEQEFRESKKDD